MTYDPYVALKFSAVALAQNAKIGRVDQVELSSLINRIEQECGSADPLFRAVSTFSSAVDMALMSFGEEQRGALADAGHDLAHAIEVLNVPVPPGQERSDIYGG